MSNADELEMIRKDSIAFVRTLSAERGVDGVERWLTEAPLDDPYLEHGMQSALQVLDPHDMDGEDGEAALKMLVRVAIATNSDEVFWRIRQWHFDDRPMKEVGVENTLTTLLRPHLASSDARTRIRALDCLWAIGWRWPQVSSDLESLLMMSGYALRDKARLLHCAGSFNAISEDILFHELSDLIRTGQSDWELDFAVASVGSPEHMPYLSSRLSSGEEDRFARVLGMALYLGSRFQVVMNDLCVDLLRKAPEAARQFSFSYFQRYFDDRTLVVECVRSFCRVVTVGGNSLFAQNLVTNLNRPSHLVHIGDIQLTAAELHILLNVAQQDSESGQVRGFTMEEYTKLAVLEVGFRLAVPELPATVKAGMLTESSQSLLTRMAECCVLSGRVKDFLPDRWREQSEESLLWMLAPEAGIGGGEETLDILLASDPRNKGDSIPEKYADGLAYASINVGSTTRLTSLLLSDSEPWRKDSVAHALRRVSVWDPEIPIDWDYVEAFLQPFELGRFSHTELLIELCDRAPDRGGRILESIPKPWSSEVAFAASLCNFDLPEVLDRVRQRSAGTNLMGGGFDEQYWAMTVGRLYSSGDLSQSQVLDLLGGHPFHDVHWHFARSLKAIPEADTTLKGRLWDHVLHSNSPSFSRSYLWEGIGRLDPDGLLHDKCSVAASQASRPAVKGYLDALLGFRESWSEDDPRVWHCLKSLIGVHSRLVDWYVGFVAVQLCPNSLTTHVQTNGLPDRTWVELAFWLSSDPDIWEQARIRASHSEWLSVMQLWRALDKLRETEEWVRNEYWPIVRDSKDRYAVWRYVQALVEFPSEWVLNEVRTKEHDSIQDGYFYNWLQKQITASLKKKREDLLKEGRLPGEEWAPSWF